MLAFTHFRKLLVGFCALALLSVLVLTLTPTRAMAGAVGQQAAVPLSTAEVDAILAEAQPRVRNKALRNTAWVALDKAKLARLLQMPDFAGLEESAKDILVEQAGAWDVMHFDSPSEAQAMWARWYPKLGLDRQVDSKDRNISIFPVPFNADAGWGQESAAMIALFNCMPPAVWFMPPDQDPMLWTVDHNAQWDAPNIFDFRQCVRKQDESRRSPFTTSPDTARGLTDAAILEKKFTDFLLTHGCTGTGPDRCLPMLHALLSLNPDNAQLVDIIKKLEPEFAVPDDQAIPAVTQKRKRVKGAAVATLRHRAILQASFITAKLPVLQQHPSAWPADDMEKTLRTLMRLTVTIHNADRPRGPYGLGTRVFNNAWARLPAADAMRPAMVDLLIKLGNEYGQAPGCTLGQRTSAGLPYPFRFGYALVKMEGEKTTCDVLPYPWLRQLYRAAADGNHPEVLKPIEGLRKFTAEGDFSFTRDGLVQYIGFDCVVADPSTAGASLTSKQADPWQICPHARALASNAMLTGVWAGTIGHHAVMACVNADGHAAYYYKNHESQIGLERTDYGWNEAVDGKATGSWTLTSIAADGLRGVWSAPGGANGTQPLQLALTRIAIEPNATPCADAAYLPKPKPPPPPKPPTKCERELLGILQRAYPSARYTPEVSEDAVKLEEKLGSETSSLDIPGGQGGQGGHIRLPGGASCLQWPAHPQYTLVQANREHWPENSAKGNYTADSGANDFATGDLDILVVNSKTGDVQYRIALPGAIVADAGNLQFRRFDTGPYDLAPGLPTFGVRTGYSAGAYGWGYNDEDMTLYTIRGGALQGGVSLKVLVEKSDGSEISYLKPGDTCETRYRIVRTVSVDRQMHHGQRDLHFNVAREDHDFTLVKPEECKEEKTTSNDSYRVMYDGSNHVMPVDLMGAE